MAEAEQTADELLSHIHESLTTTLETPVTTPSHGSTEEHKENNAPPASSEPLVISRFASSVDLSDRNLTDAHFKQLAGGLFVRRLNLGGTPTNDEHLRLLQIPTLENLDLSGTQVSDAGLRHLSMLPALMHLNLANTTITDEGLKTLGPIRLQTLDLNGTKITDAGLAHLGNTYGMAGQLRSLNLSNTAITDECVGSMKKFSHLERLDLRQTKVTASGIQAIREALPDCTIGK